MTRLPAHSPFLALILGPREEAGAAALLQTEALAADADARRQRELETRLRLAHPRYVKTFGVDDVEQEVGVGGLGSGCCLEQRFQACS